MDAVISGTSGAYASASASASKPSGHAAQSTLSRTPCFLPLLPARRVVYVGSASFPPFSGSDRLDKLVELD